jgi:hypothetical protein
VDNIKPQPFQLSKESFNYFVSVVPCHFVPLSPIGCQLLSVEPYGCAGKYATIGIGFFYGRPRTVGSRKNSRNKGKN